MRISMLHFPLETRPLAGFIRPPARTQKWFCSALPAQFRVTLICLSLSCGSTNWLIHSLSGRSGCRLLCEISCRFWCPEGLWGGVREEDYRFSVSVGVIAWKWSECWRLLPLLCLFLFYFIFLNAFLNACFVYEQEFTWLLVQIQGIIVKFSYVVTHPQAKY